MKSLSEKQVFTVLDCENRPLSTIEMVYLWNSYGHDDFQFSLLTYCEENAVRLREKYCKWIFNLGDYVIDGKRVVDHLGFEDGFSYWWMTLLVEKSLWKSPQIKDAIRILALEEIIVKQKPNRVRLVSANKNLHRIMSGLCMNLSIVYEWDRRPDQSSHRLSIRYVYQLLPQPAKAVINIARQMFIWWPLNQTQKPNWFKGKRNIFFCSYYANIDPNKAKRGSFYSFYWKDLHSLLDQLNLQINWLHLFISCDTIKTPRFALNWLQGFNRRSQKEGFHNILQAYMSWYIVLYTIKRWLKLVLLSWRLHKIKYAFSPEGSRLSLWPIMKEDWYASMRGAVAVNNLLLMELFNRMMDDLPHQTKGLYLFENQAWERAFVHTWRKKGHGKLIAVPHSTRSFWDIRFYRDSKIRNLRDPYPLPHPDLIAVNGKAALEIFHSENYDEEIIIKCEALRYCYLNDLRAVRDKSRKTKKVPIQILILGDYRASVTIKMLKLLELAESYITKPVAYTMKPHPEFMVNPLDYPSLDLDIILDSLEDILYNFDKTYSSYMTSASVDAYFAGLSVVVMLDDTDLKFSPLHSQPDVCFVSFPNELALALQVDTGDTYKSPRLLEDFFWLDTALPRWKALLELE